MEFIFVDLIVPKGITDPLPLEASLVGSGAKSEAHCLNLLNAKVKGIPPVKFAPAMTRTIAAV